MTLVVLTGATRGIGQAAALELSRSGAELAIVGRDAERVSEVAREAQGTGGGAPVHEHVADLTSMAQVRALGDELLARYQHIDVLANNAGALFARRALTAEGFERTFALNHLAPFLLTNLLLERLRGGRVVTTASDAHTSGRLDLSDLQSERSYAAMRVYGTTKLCTGVVRTGFGKNENGIWKQLTTVAGPIFRSPARGARSLVWLALTTDAASLDGAYVENEKVVAPSAQAQDDTLAAQLWEQSSEIVGLSTSTPA